MSNKLDRYCECQQNLLMRASILDQLKSLYP